MTVSSGTSREAVHGCVARNPVNQQPVAQYALELGTNLFGHSATCKISFGSDQLNAIQFHRAEGEVGEQACGAGSVSLALSRLANPVPEVCEIICRIELVEARRSDERARRREYRKLISRTGFPVSLGALIPLERFTLGKCRMAPSHPPTNRRHRFGRCGGEVSHELGAIGKQNHVRIAYGYPRDGDDWPLTLETTGAAPSDADRKRAAHARVRLTASSGTERLA